MADVLTNAQMQAVIAAGGSVTWRGASYGSWNVGSLPSDADIVAYLAASTIGTTVFGASGASHAAGLVPDPGSTAGTTRYLREDATFAVPAGGGGSSISSGTFAARPAASTAGRLYLPTDDILTYYDTGTSWLGYYGSIPVVPFNHSLYTSLNLGTSTLGVSKGPATLVCQNSGSASARIRWKTLNAASNYTATMYLKPSLALTNSSHAGIVLRESSSSKLTTFGIHWTGSVLLIAAYTWSSETALTGTAFSVQVGDGGGFLKIVDDGTNRIYSFGVDPLNYLVVGSQARSANGTPDQIGYYMSSVSLSGSLLSSATFLCLQETAP